MKKTLTRPIARPARAIIAGGVAVILVVAVAVFASRSTAAPAVRTQDELITAPGGPGVSGPVSLDATMYLPPNLPAPAVIMAHGFGGSKDSVAGDARDLAGHGFVVLAYSARGFGRSTGQIALDSLDYEIPDARAVVDWLATRPEVVQDGRDDPRVGVTGGSYGGALSLMLAGTDKRVDAAVPLITWNSLSQALFPNAQVGAAVGNTPAAAAGTTDGVFKKAWAATLISSVTTGAGLTAGAIGTAPSDNGDSGFGRGQGSSNSAPAPALETTAASGSRSSAAAGSGSTTASGSRSSAAAGSGSSAGSGSRSSAAAGSGSTTASGSRSSAAAGSGSTTASGSRSSAAAGSGSTTASGSRSAAGAGGVDATSSVGCGRLMPTLCAAYSQAAQTGREGPGFTTLLAKSSPSAVVGNITAPTLLIQGERDTLFGLDQADANARAIAANGTTVALTWYNGGHDGPSAPDQVTRDRITGWFQHYLAGSGPVPTNNFVYSVDGPIGDNGRARTRTLSVPQYPGLTGNPTDRQQIPLTGSGQLAVNPPGGSPAGISSLPGLSGLAGTALAVLSGGLPGQVARFVSAPLNSLTVLTGTPRITVQVARVPIAPGPTGSNLSDSGAVLFASWSKITGTGIQTLAGSAVAPIRITDLPADGTAKTVTVALPAAAFQIENGSRIQVSLSTTDQAYAGSTSPAAYRISLGGDRAVSVPTVGGVRISAGEVPIATLVALIVLAVLAVLALILGGRVFRRRPADRPRGASGTPGRPASDPGLPLIIRGLRKSYPGGVIAVADVSFQVQRGQVLGLLGPNGAGKTTTLRMVMGLITPTAGDIEVFGHPVRPGAEILSRIGSFVEGSGFLPHLSGQANLELYWRATGRPAADGHLSEALEIAGLGSAVRRKVKTYSQGMRQRLAIAQAMLGLPDLLLMDEPTNGLDPPQIHAMREVLRGYAATGRTVLVSSHLLSEVEQTCSHVVVVNQGRTIASGTVAELVSTSGDVVFTVDDADRAVAVLRAMPGVGEVNTGDQAGTVIANVGEQPTSRAVADLVLAGVAVSSAAPRNRLEDVFLELVGASGPGVGFGVGIGASANGAAPAAGLGIAGALEPAVAAPEPDPVSAGSNASTGGTT